MNEFLTAYGASIASAIVSAAAAVCGICSLVKAHHAKKILKDAESRMTMVKCPYCHKKSPLSQVSFILPDGSVDNNLNGVPDNQE